MSISYETLAHRIDELHFELSLFSNEITYLRNRVLYLDEKVFQSTEDKNSI